MDEILGNGQIKCSLERMIASGRIANSFLFAGREGIGKSLFAISLAKKIMKIESSEHPDLHHLRAEGKVGMHSMDALRRFQEEIHLPPYQAPWKIFIIHDAERMLPSSANALLKSFEEPPKHTVIILLSSSPEELLPTILSRCIQLHFQPLKREEIETYLQNRAGVSKELAKKAALRSEGSLSHAIALCKEGSQSLVNVFLEYLSMEEKRRSSYLEIKKIAAYLAEKLEALRKILESEADQLYSVEFLKSLSAAQREVYDKEIQGMVSVRFHAEMRDVFYVLLAWFRDEMALQSDSSSEFLSFPEYKLALGRSTMTPFLFLKIEKSLKEALLSVERFLPLSSVIETLLLKINRLLQHRLS